ncbi:hypothetical protein LINPERHAP1_LOCUS1998, partial [Linum perenne]
EVEPFLEQYAKRSPANQPLIGSSGSFVRIEDFMAIIEVVRTKKVISIEKERWNLRVLVHQSRKLPQ